MKRHGNLWKDVCDFRNLLKAARLAQRGKRFQRATARFNFKLEYELLRLKNELENRTYRPGEYRAFYIHDPKKRLISAAPYRDRIVHHALCNVLEPIFEKSFIHDSYACRKGKGTHRAVDRLQKFARQKRFALKCDIRKFFPSVDHEILKAHIKRKVKDKDVLWLVDEIIDGSNEQERHVQYFPDDDLFAPFTRRKGLPIGNQTSQFFGNVYLDPLDHFVKEVLRFKCYVRYVDDFVLLSDDKAELKDAKAKIETFLVDLRLKIHPAKSQVFPVGNGIRFLGFRVFQKHRLLVSENVRRLRKRLRKFSAEYAEGRKSPAEIKCSLTAWQAHAAHADTKILTRKVLSEFVLSRRQAV